MSIESVREKHNSLFEQLSASGGSSLAPSRIAGQFYCEKKVDLTREHGDIETPAKTRGVRLTRKRLKIQSRFLTRSSGAH